MKNIIGFAVVILFFIQQSFAQVITVEPPFPTDLDEVVITFNAAEGSAGLAGYSGDVYAHTGLITNNSTSGSDWKYVVSDWGVNIPKAKLTRIATDLYTLNIGPDIRSYYGAPQGETIEKLAFVFRSATQVNGSWLEGKTADGGDIFYEVYEAGLQVSIIQPDQKQLLVEAHEQIAVKVVSNMADSTVLTLNDIPLISTTQNSINHTITAEEEGLFFVKAIAYANNETAVDSFMFFVRPSLTIEEVPEGIRDGINYINDSTVILSLFAPYKSYVFVIGEFNNWSLGVENYMKRSPDSQRYWLQLNGLEPGTEYAYQYFIDNTLRIADPYADKVLDPWNDHYISETTYPNLKAYPAGKTTGIVSVFQTGQEEFNWQITEFTPPAKEDLIIYELHIRDFVATRTIKTVMDSLDYLQRLGVNAIELMPINEFEGNDSWGYNPSFYFAPDKAYGTKDDYKRLIDECHRRGIAVILDVVLNHAYGQNPMVQMYFDPSAGNGGQPSPQNPWFNQTCPHEPWCWGYDFNHESVHTQAFVDRFNSYWLTEYKVDGFRFDFTKGFTNVQTGNQGWNYDAARIAILKRMAEHIWTVNEDAYVILEHFADNAEERTLSAHGMMLWGNMNHAYNQATMGYQSESDFSAVSYKKRGWNNPYLIGYMESHDEERLMYKNLTYGNQSNTHHNVRALDIAVKRNAAAAAMFFLVPGPKMIWQFGELGYDVSIDYPCRVCPKPIRWEYQQDWDRRLLYNYYKSLIAVRNSHPVFKSNDFVLNASSLQKSLHLFHEDMSVAVLANFDVVRKEINPQFYFTGTWYEYYSGDSLLVTDVSTPISLRAGEFRIYSSKKLERPDFVGLEELILGNNRNLRAYPNPFTNEFEIHLAAETSSNHQIDIVDLLGRQIGNVFEGYLEHGPHYFTISKEVMDSNGIYLVRVNDGQFIQIVKVVRQD